MLLPILDESMYNKANAKQIKDYELGDKLSNGHGPYIAIRHDGDIVISCYKDSRLSNMGNTVKVSVKSYSDEEPRIWTMNPLFNDALRDDEEIMALFEYVIRSISRMNPEKVNDWCRAEGFN